MTVRINKERLRAAVQPRRLAIALLLTAAAFLVVMQSPINPWLRGTPSNDSSVFQYVAMVISEGGMPYRDVFDHKGPLLYLINCLGYILNGQWGIWAVEWVNMILMLCLFYRIARLRCGPWPACLAVVIAAANIFPYFQGGNYSEEYAMTFIALALYFFLDYLQNDRVSTVRLVLLGASFGAVLLLRANMVGVWAIFSVVIFVRLLLHRQYRQAAHCVALFLGGAALLMAPILLWLAVGGAWPNFIHDYLIFNFGYASDAGLLMLLLVLREQVQRDVVLWACGLILLYAWLAQKPGREKRLALLYAAATALCLALAFFSAQPFDHYYLPIIPMEVYPLAMAVGAWEHGAPRECAAGAFLAGYLLLCLTIPHWFDGLNGFIHDHGYRDADNRDVPMMWTVEEIEKDTAPEDRITIYSDGRGATVHLWSGRLAASRYVYQTVAYYDDAIWQEYYAQLQSDPPKMVILDQYIIENDYRALPEHNEKMQEFVQTQGYRLVRDARAFKVYLREE